MRSDEMLLNAAEACARQGKESEAKDLLWQLQDMRGAVRTEASGEELVKAIWIERRKELYGEGFALFDIIRNELPLERTGNHVDWGGATPFPARSWRLIYQIPNTELLNNESMTDAVWPNGDQNPFEGTASRFPLFGDTKDNKKGCQLHRNPGNWQPFCILLTTYYFFNAAILSFKAAIFVSASACFLRSISIT